MDRERERKGNAHQPASARSRAAVPSVPVERRSALDFRRNFPQLLIIYADLSPERRTRLQVRMLEEGVPTRHVTALEAVVVDHRKTDTDILERTQIRRELAL